MCSSDLLGGTHYFDISVNTTTGVVTFSENTDAGVSIYNATGGTGSFDEAALLTVSGGTLNIVQTVTDKDGDALSASLSLGSGVFAIQDSGPSLTGTAIGAADKLTLDESTGTTEQTAATETASAVYTTTAGLHSTTANFADNFAGVIDAGADGVGSTTYALNLAAATVGGTVASGMYAVAAGGGQGSALNLYVDAKIGRAHV